jgi:2-phospho-L-lactate guanylyltransferase
MPRHPGPHDTGVVLPLRSFSHGKARLAQQLGVARREQLVRAMAERVVDAAGALPVVVVSSAPEVRAWAADRDLACLIDPGSLDGAAEAGRDHFREGGFLRVVVVHGDLPLARTLAHVSGGGAQRVAVLVPSHRDGGTPVLAIPAGVPFAFTYGHGSFERHCAHARALGLDVRVVHDDALGFDVDVPDDLARCDLTEHLGLDRTAPSP